MKHLLLVLCVSFSSAQADTLQDPTEPTKPSPSGSHNTAGQEPNILAPITLRLTAIINSNQNKQAIINGESVVEGQQVQDYKVMLISQNHVVLNGSDGKQTLFVNNNHVKTDVNNVF